MNAKLFGRDPAMIISMIYAGVMMLSTFAVRGVDEPLAAAIQLFLTAAATAWAALQVRPMAPAVFTGVIVAGAALGARFGWDLTEVQIAGVTSFVAVVVMLVGARPQQTPVVSPAPVLAWAPPAEDIRARPLR
jgi:hypothetical protein